MYRLGWEEALFYTYWGCFGGENKKWKLLEGKEDLEDEKEVRRES